MPLRPYSCTPVIVPRDIFRRLSAFFSSWRLGPIGTHVNIHPIVANRNVRGITVRALAIGMLLLAFTILVHFPYHADVVNRPTAAKTYTDFYKQVYSAPQVNQPEPEPEDSRYVAIARQVIQDTHIVDRVEAFIQKYGVKDKRALDVGAGTGYLQDMVQDYVGLDISPAARRFFHKPFVQASATDMPFPDGTFDVVWSIWVLEHVPTPEQALLEIRRVAKDGGLLFMLPAWNCLPWAADGYDVRPYSDFGLKGKLIKASGPVRESILFKGAYMIPIRLMRQTYAALSREPTRFHYWPITPNYSHYWQPDSDAVNSFDRIELMLWFTSRGDECLNCEAAAFRRSREVIIRVHKH